MSYLPTIYRFCPQCGKPLQSTDIGGRPRETCADCSYVNWGEYSLGVGGVLWRGDKVLLVQRSYNPGKGMWTIPGGYVDHDEPIGEAITREVLEETGIHAEPLSIIALRDRPDAKHDTYIIFLLKDGGGALQAQPEEVSDLGFFTLEECQLLPVAALTLSAIEASVSAAQGLTLKTNVKLIGTQSTLYQLS